MNPKRAEFEELFFSPKEGLFGEHGEYIVQKSGGAPICYYCEKLVSREDFEVDFTYWGANYIGVHRDCIKTHKKATARECQIIDAGCNDCVSFLRKRGPGGTCRKTGEKITDARPNYCAGKPCFEHRI